jgi:hypothetical protein
MSWVEKRERDKKAKAVLQRSGKMMHIVTTGTFIGLTLLFGGVSAYNLITARNMDQKQDKTPAQVEEINDRRSMGSTFGKVALLGVAGTITSFWFAKKDRENINRLLP